MYIINYSDDHDYADHIRLDGFDCQALGMMPRAPTANQMSPCHTTAGTAQIWLAPRGYR